MSYLGRTQSFVLALWLSHTHSPPLPSQETLPFNTIVASVFGIRFCDIRASSGLVNFRVGDSLKSDISRALYSGSLWLSQVICSALPATWSRVLSSFCLPLFFIPCLASCTDYILPHCCLLFGKAISKGETLSRQ